MSQNKYVPTKHNRRIDATLIIVLGLLPFLFFWRLITPNPADRMAITAGDFTEQYFPLRAFSAQQWVQSQIPLWNPYLYGGQPALADIQSGALYPPHVIEALVLGWGSQSAGFPVWALELQVILHFSLAAVGIYLFARHLGLQSGVSLRRARWGGIIASLAFTYSGYLTGFPVQQMTILLVSAWLPWLMWAVSVASRCAVLRMPWPQWLPPLAWGALVLAMAILAGHPQTVLYLVYLSLAYLLFRAFAAWQVDFGYKLLLRLLGTHLLCWGGIVALGMVMTAAQLWPTLEFIAHSLRADLAYAAVSGGLPLNELIAVVYPGFFGGSPEYVGIVTLVLVALALVVGRPRVEIFFWAGAALVSLVLAFGGNTFLYALFYLLAPGFEAVRQQERVFLIYAFSMAMLAGYGTLAISGPLQKMARQYYTRTEKNLRIVILVGFVLTAFLFYGLKMAMARGNEVNLFYGVLWHHLFGLLMLTGVAMLLWLRGRRRLFRTGGMILLALWLAFNLFTVNWRFNLEPKTTGPFESGGVVQFLQTQLPATDTSLAQKRLASGGLLPGGNSAASVYRLQDLTGNTPLQLTSVNAFLQRMPSWRMWQLMNVLYVVDQRDISGPGLSLVFEEGERRVFEMDDPFPRAWFVSQVEVVPDDDRALARLADDNFNLRQAAIVTQPLADSLDETAGSTISITSLTPTHLTADINATGTQLLALSQIYYPGWQARLDDQPVNLRRVNMVQQGVVVPAGVHTLEVSFEPRSFRWGIWISLAGLLVGLLMLMSQIKKPRYN